MLSTCRFAGSLTALSLALLVCLGSAPAGQVKDGNETAENENETAELAFNQIDTAYNLIGYARREKSPEAMLAAVHILWNTPAAEFKGEIEGGEAVKLPPQETQLDELLNEARKMRPDDEHLNVLANRMQNLVEEKSRAVLLEAGESAEFLRLFSRSFSFTRAFAPTTGKLRVYNQPGAGLIKDWKIRIKVYRGTTLIRTETATLTFANPSIYVSFLVPKVEDYKFEITNFTPGSPLLLFRVW